MARCRLLYSVAFLILMGAPTLPGAATPGDSPDITVKGEIVDLACYIAHGAKGPEHQKCAERCAAIGQPLGLLTPEGKLYVLVADHQDPSALVKAKKLAGEQVEMTGEPSERDGVAAIAVRTVKK
jgi:hypothetical protein